MKEYQRQIAIEQVRKDIKERETLNAKYEELEKQKQEPAVIAYFNLLEDIKLLEKKYKNYETEEEIIEWGFREIIKDFKCSHPIWLYTASEYTLIDIYRYEHDRTIRELSENCETSESFVFENNEYCCLECGKRIAAKNWEQFERTHFVLKNQNEYIDERYYLKLYWRLLYTKSTEEAQKIVIEEFNKNKEESKTKTLKKQR